MSDTSPSRETKQGNTTTIKAFTYIQVFILALFSLVTLFTITRLNDVYQSLELLTQQTVPEIFEANTISRHVDELATLTVALANANSDPALRLVKRRINDTIEKLTGSSLAQDSENAFLYRQITALEQELEELNGLIERQILSTQKLDADKARMYTLFQDFLADSAFTEEAFYQETIELLLIASRVDQQDRLQQLRQIESSLATQLSRASAMASGQVEVEAALSQINDILLGRSGIVNQKIELLRIAGRARGRGNLVRNLVIDVANSLEHSSRLTFQQTRNQSAQTEIRIKQQNLIAIIAGSFTVLLTLVVIYYLHKRVVSRVLSLTQQVDNAANNKVDAVTVKGSDEISHLADAFTLYVKKVRQQEIELVNMSLTDPLTSIPNRRAFNQQLDSEIAHATRHRWPLTLLLIDVDYFKAFNDHYGHGEGDTCLKAVAEKLHGVVHRNTDFCARFGGEEFVCILPNTDEKGAIHKAEELRSAIESMAIEHAGAQSNSVVTISIGSATFPFTSHNVWSHDAIIEKADSALYKAKDQGRNRCIHFSAD